MSNLFDGIENGEAHTRAFVEAMKTLYNFNHVGFVYGGGTAVFERKNTYYHMTDNGGELNVCTVNKNNTVGIPFTSTRGPLNAGTIAYRVWKVTNGSYGLIEWDWVMDSVEGFEIGVDILAPMQEEIDMDRLMKGDGRY